MLSQVYNCRSSAPVFQEIVDRVREIIPSVDNITVTPIQNGKHEILIWTDRTSKNVEQSFSLENSGTGISQIIAILTAVVTSKSGIIVIDEISSFLHPSAVKKLLTICRTFYPEHQYIVSTHSPEVLTFDGVDSIFLVERKGFESSIKKLDKTSRTDLSLALNHIGIGMLDVLGYDHVIWVEGPTEEICFPLVLKKFSKSIPPSLSFTALSSTGDFSRKGTSKKAVIQIYENTMKTVAPLTKGSAFTLDRDGMSAANSADIERQTDSKLLILPRRNFESYLIQPKAILSVINGSLLDGFVNLEDVSSALARLGGDRRFSASSIWKADIYDTVWLEKVDGARLLMALFDEVTGHRVAYIKTVHGPQILERMEKSDLSGIFSHISRLLKVALD